MNKVVCLFLIIYGFEVWAETNVFPKYVCSEYDKKTKQLLSKTLVLNPIESSQDVLDDEGNFVGTTTAFFLQIFSGANDIPMLEAQGIVINEDVNFYFISDDGSIEFFMYLDEVENSTLTLVEDGKVSVSPNFICR